MPPENLAGVPVDAPWTLRAMQHADLPAVLAIEQASHLTPWSHGNFADSLQTGCYMPVLGVCRTLGVESEKRPQRSQKGAAAADSQPTIPKSDRLLAAHRQGQQQPLAYLVAMPGFEEAHLLNITVHPALRGKGLGRVLLQWLDVWAQQQRAQQIWLEVRQSNLAAQGLYRSAGYADVALRKHYYAGAPGDAQAREHALVMCKRLAD